MADRQRPGFYLECNSGLFGSENLPAKVATLIGGPTPQNQQWVRDNLPHLGYEAGIGHDDVNKISFVLEPAVDLEWLAAEFGGQAKVDTWSLNGTDPEFGEIGQIGIHKGIAVQLLSEHLGVSVDDFIAFGDARSDIELLTICGTGVAMGNSPAELKEVADLVTDHVDADGLAKAFRALGLTADSPEIR